MKQGLILTTTLLMAAVLVLAASCGTAATPGAAPAPTPGTAARPGPGPAPTGAPGRTQGQRASGTLTSIDGSTLTLAAVQGSVTVDVSPATTVQKTVAGSLADLNVGQSLAIFGTADASGNIAATSVTIRPQGQGAPPTSPAGTTRPGRTSGAPRGGGAARGAFGTLIRIDGSTLTLNATQGAVTVNVGPDTTIQKTLAGTLTDLAEGQSLTVIGTPEANGSITANSIIIQIEGQGAPPTRPGRA